MSAHKATPGAELDITVIRDLYDAILLAAKKGGACDQCDAANQFGAHHRDCPKLAALIASAPQLAADKEEFLDVTDELLGILNGYDGQQDWTCPHCAGEIAHSDHCTVLLAKNRARALLAKHGDSENG